MEWENYWKEFIKEKKLQGIIREMDEVDEALGHELRIEEICHMIYEDYETNLKIHLEEVRQEFLKILDTFQNVHLQTSRIKKIDSLLEKIINKRYRSLKDSKSEYIRINKENYKNIITDLIGMRIIINYRGNWILIHNEIIKHFPLDLKMFQGNDKNPNDITLLHPKNGDNILAQIPIAYYAENDDISEYQYYGLNTRRHEMGYRSIHYIVSFQNVYIEIQVRTIYDEAWSDCDHGYVYKHDDNLSHTALKRMSHILSDLTNISNDIGENMRVIYEKNLYYDVGNGSWETTEESRKALDIQVKRVFDIYNKLLDFQKCVQIKQEVE